MDVGDKGDFSDQVKERPLTEQATLPLVSAGMTTYNQPDYLKLALDAVLNQTHSNLEIIISEDCTPCEKTKALIREYAQKDSRIKSFSQPTNIGPPANLQFVLKQASGEYFFWADDDDLRDERWIEVLLQKLAVENTVAALSNVVAIDPVGNVVMRCRPLQFVGPRTFRLAHYFLAEGAEGTSNIVCGLFRTTFLRSIKHWAEYDRRFLDDRHFLAVDMLFVLDCLQHGNVLAVPSVTLYKRRSVNKCLPVSSTADLFHRIYKRLQYDLVCVGMVDSWLDKAVLLSLIPVKLIKQLSYKVMQHLR
jgi:glycosyltransferase involved in cell wall biosynthesis